MSRYHPSARRRQQKREAEEMARYYRERDPLGLDDEGRYVIARYLGGSVMKLNTEKFDTYEEAYEAMPDPDTYEGPAWSVWKIQDDGSIVEV